MTFIQKENVSFFQVREERRKIARLLKRGACAGLYVRSQLICNNMRKGGFPKTGTSVKKEVLKSIPPLFRGLNDNPEVIFYPLLS